MLNTAHPIELVWLVVNLAALFYAGKEAIESKRDYRAQEDDPLAKKIARGNLRREATRVLTLLDLLIVIVMVIWLPPDRREVLSTQATIVRCGVIFVLLIKGFDSFFDSLDRVELRKEDRRRSDQGRSARREPDSRKDHL